MKMIQADLHNHLGRNGEFSSFNNVIDLAHERLGDGGIFGIVNTGEGRSKERCEIFFNSPGYDRDSILDRRFIFVPEKNIYVARMQEVFTEQGHLVVGDLPIGVYIQDGNSLEYSAEQTKDRGGTTISPHPFSPMRGTGQYLNDHPEVLKFIDGFETYNGSAALFHGANRKAKRFYDTVVKGYYDTGQCSFTDGHDEEVIARCSTALPKTSLEFLAESIRANKEETGLIKKPIIKDAAIHAIRMVTGI